MTSQVAFNPTTIMPTTEANPAGQDLAQKTVCLRVTFGLIGNTRKVSNSNVECDADKSLIRVNKQLLDSPELEAIRRADGEVRRYLYDTCLTFDVGIHLLPLPAIEMVETRLREFRDSRTVLVSKFMGAYDRLQRNAEDRLRTLYNPKDYPEADAVRAKFEFTWRYISFGVPAVLGSINREIWEQEREKASSMWADAAGEIQTLMRTTMGELVGHLAAKLADDGSGKKRVFRDSAVTNLREFLTTFEFRNVADDAALAREVSKARALLATVPDVDVLRNVASLRDSVRSGLESIKTSLDSLTTARPIRKIRED